jgi:hypothetical protein
MFLRVPDPHPDPLVTSTDLRILPFFRISVERTEIMITK